MSFPVKYFQGKLNNKNVYDFIKQLDFNLKQKDRVELVKKILYTDKDKYIDEYFQIYFDEKYNYKPLSDEYLSADNNVCNVLESMANYILFSSDAEKIKKTQYNFYTTEKLKRKFGKDLSVEELLERSYKEVSDSDIINMIVDKKKNYKCLIKQVISKKDIDELKPVRQYEDYKADLIFKKNELKLSGSNKKLQKKITITLEELKYDQLLCKDMLRKTIYFKAPLKDSTDIDYEQFDFSNSDHIKQLLLVGNNNVITDLGCLVNDLNNLIDNSDFAMLDLKIIKMYRSGVKLKEIAEKFSVTQQNISKFIRTVCNVISDTYDESYIDYFYREVAKGKYKKCSKCKEVKLVRMFYKNSDRLDGLRSNCKKCH
jgi:hypothetical protein